MNLEGKIAGYNKKTVVIALVAIILAGVFFYAGAKYEKNKLISLKLMKNNAKDVCTPAVSKKTTEQQGVTTTTLVPGSTTTTTIKNSVNGAVK